MKKISITSFLIFDMIIVIIVVSLMTVFPIESPEPMFSVNDAVCPDLSGGNYWTVYVDNMSTSENEMFIIWEGYEGEFMNAEHLIPAVNHTYRFTYVGSNTSFWLDMEATR